MNNLGHKLEKDKSYQDYKEKYRPIEENYQSNKKITENLIHRPIQVLNIFKLNNIFSQIVTLLVQVVY